MNLPALAQAAILLFVKREAKPKYQCFQCQRPMERRSESNTPAYCSYECGANGQPNAARRTLGQSRNGNNEKS